MIAFIFVLIYVFYLFAQFVMFFAFHDIISDSVLKVNNFKSILRTWFAINLATVITALLYILCIKHSSLIFGIMIILIAIIHIILCANLAKYARKMKINEVLTTCTDKNYNISAIDSYIHSYGADKFYKTLITPLHNLITARDSFATTETKVKYDEEVLNKEIEIFIKNFEYLINKENENHEKAKEQQENIAKIADEKILNDIKKNYKGLKKYYE